jgi:cytochrome c553
MRPVVLTLALIAGLGVAGAVAVVGLGLYNVSARVGHLPGVSWVLHTTFRNSVRLRAGTAEDMPPLDNPELIALGAGHYATACAPCHAEPGGVRTATMRALVPVPPPIEEAVLHWDPNELHWIVDNGIKMSGMPAWPVAERKDEVWAVVAYLAAIKAGEAPELPQAAPDTDPRAYCATCHGTLAGEVPRLDIQSPAYLAAQLHAYRSGARPSGIMAQAASVVPAELYRDLARYFAGRDRDAPEFDHRPERAARGAQLARKGTRDVPACLACHGREGRAEAKGPMLDGQHVPFLETQLTLWRDGVYAHDALMQSAARDLTDDDITALAQYFATR